MMHIKRKFLFYTFLGVLILSLTFFVVHSIKNKQQHYEPLESSENNDGIANGIHINTGLVDAEGLPLVIAHCTSCHSAKLITQNRLSKEGWRETIKWMQETQNLWDLGDDEEMIVTYLSKNYAPTDKGRRDILTNIEWYTLKD